MDDLWDKRIEVTPPGGSKPTMNIRPTSAAWNSIAPHVHKGPLADIIQRIQPSIHRWDTDVVFSVERLKKTTGWAPEHSFDSAVEATYRWWSSTDLHETVEQDYTYEDEILELVRKRG